MSQLEHCDDGPREDAGTSYYGTVATTPEGAARLRALPQSIELITAPAEPSTLTLAELAAELRIGMTKAHQMARTDALPIPTLKVGREYRFSRRALERWLDGDAAQRDDAA
jgi:hypothetical protein